MTGNDIGILVYTCVLCNKLRQSMGLGSRDDGLRTISLVVMDPHYQSRGDGFPAISLVVVGSSLSVSWWWDPRYQSRGDGSQLSVSWRRRGNCDINGV